MLGEVCGEVTLLARAVACFENSYPVQAIVLNGGHFAAHALEAGS